MTRKFPHIQYGKTYGQEFSAMFFVLWCSYGM